MKNLKNFASPHVHIRSFDSASTPEAFAQRELELGGEFITVTDHGTLEATRQIYDLTAKGGKYHGKLTPILGLEAYFRDDDCPILHEQGVPQNIRYRHQITGKLYDTANEKQAGEYEALPDSEKTLCLMEAAGFWGHLKYMHLTMHALDEEALNTISRLISKADLRAEQHGSERKPLFSWKDLEELGSKNITFCSSCLIGMVSRHLLAHNDWQTAIKYYDRLRNTVKPGNFYVEMFPHTCDRNWDDGVFLKYADGTEEKFAPWKKLKTLEGDFKAEQLAEDFRKNAPAALEKHQYLAGVMQNRKMIEQAPKPLVGVERREGYLMNECRPWSPDGDVQLGVNRFVLEVAKRYGDPILVSDDCLAAGTLIRTNEGYLPIEHVTPGMLVVGHDGSRQTVEATRGLFSNKEMIEVSGRGWSLTMTSDHRLWARPSRKWGTAFDQTFTEPEWIEAGKLPQGSWICLPKPHPVPGLKKADVDLSLYFTHNNGKYVKIDECEIHSTSRISKETKTFSRYLKWDSELAFLVGLFLGDGNAHNNLVSFALDKETWSKLGHRLKSFVERYKFSSDETAHPGHVVFRIICGPLAQWFRRNFYQNKVKVPGPAKDLQSEFRWEVVAGLIWSDGSNRNGNDSDGKINLSNASLPLISWVREQCLAEGVWVSFTSRFTVGSTMPLYTIDFDHNLFRHVQLWKMSSAPKKQHVKYTDSGYWVRVNKIEHSEKQGPVYDLQVSGTNSFSTVFAAVHNCHFARPEEKIAQDVRLGQNGSWRFANSHHRFSNAEAFEWFQTRMGISEKEFEGWVENSHEWGSRFKDFKFKSRKVLPTSFYPQDTLSHTWKLIEKHGRMDWNSKVHMERLAAEIRLLHKNGVIDLLPYFMIDEEACDLYLKNGLLTGPGRGSAAGLLLTYLLGITHVDPLKYGLSMDRFMTQTRIESGKLPDIDQDLSDRKLLEGWESPGIEITLEDGTVRTIEENQLVNTPSGLMRAEEAFKRGLDVELEPK